MVTIPNKLNEFNHAEDPARRLLAGLGYPMFAQFPLTGGTP